MSIPVAKVNAERPVKNGPGGHSRLASEGFSSETDPAVLGRREEPAGVWDSGGVLDWADQPHSDPRLSPRACARPAGRFHRSATRGELAVTVAAGIDRYPG